VVLSACGNLFEHAVGGLCEHLQWSGRWQRNPAHMVDHEWLSVRAEWGAGVVLAETATARSIERGVQPDRVC
jgi:hypothetical protein